MVIIHLLLCLCLMDLASAICGKNTTYHVGKTRQYHLKYQEKNFGKTKRFFYVDIPENYNASNKYTVLFYFHGHGSSGFK